jgi:hypothetical protein
LGSTVREAFSGGDFVNITVDGQRHSSDPSSTFFDQGLAGATGSTLHTLTFAGGDQSTLILGPEALVGPFTVLAPSAAVRTEGSLAATDLTIQAQSITVTGTLHAGAITLAGLSWVTVEAGGVVRADPGIAGGRIDVSANVLVNNGWLDASGPSGGQITLSAINVLNTGRITADALSAGGDGGVVQIPFTGAYIDTVGAMTSANGGITGQGGTLTVNGGTTGSLFSSGKQQALGSDGGTIDLLGRDIVLAGGLADASGEFGGGSIRVGGDFQGGNPAIPNSQTVTVTGARAITADALDNGDGGRVIVWADQNTTFDGFASARGGRGGGRGGLIEVSGSNCLTYVGSADASAPAGEAGMLLLDPKNLVIDASAGVFPQFQLIDPHPTPGAAFGWTVLPLHNGNVVVTNPDDNFGGSEAGAIYLFDGQTGALISSLVGSHPGDQVGRDGVTPLSNGNFVARSFAWNGVRGAVTWGDGSLGVSGVVSSDNSLVGSDAHDRVGGAVTALSNGNYVVASWYWNSSRGAVTWGSGDVGISGPLSAANSLVGSNPLDYVGSTNPPLNNLLSTSGVIPLGNGNYVVSSPLWNNASGAATWADGTVGVAGTVSEENSLVGTVSLDRVGGGGITVLKNGNYVVSSPFWNHQSGAATWADGTVGVSGTITAENSLVGANPNDLVSGRGITELSNGNYVVASPEWNGKRGAVTWVDGTAGTQGPVTAANSLVGSQPNDNVGHFGVTALTNGNYVVMSPTWNGQLGAATWVDGTHAVSDVVSAANSLVGSNPHDQVGWSVTALHNGNYVVSSYFWNSGRGAVTWVDGTKAVSEVVSAANSLVGGNPSDVVGLGGGITLLSNGNYVVGSGNWNAQRGAATWGSATSGVTGIVSASNSLIGSNPGDLVGNYQTVPLSDGNYVVRSINWNNDNGAATWGNGTTGITGTISAANSLIGTSGDQVGFIVTTLSNGNYVVSEPGWNDRRGAATLGSASGGVTGTISAANSLVGSNPSDQVSIVTALSDGNYLVAATSTITGGSVTWVDGMSGKTMDGSPTVTPQNSLSGVDNAFENLANGTFLAATGIHLGGSGQVLVGVPNPNLLTFAQGQAQTVTITPGFLTRTLNAGTAVVLQASNDIIVNSPILVSASGHGGALTLQAGRSILLNASIKTDNGDLTLIANDTADDGVVNSQRDPGKAVISMASGTMLDTGTGALKVALRDGSELSNRDSGAITLQTIIAASTHVINQGPSLASDIHLGAVTTSGRQDYRSPHGTIFVTANLTAHNHPITFRDSVALTPGILLTAGSSEIQFVRGFVSTTPGVVTIAGGAVLTRASTFQADLNGTTAGSGYSQLVVHGPVDLGGARLDLRVNFVPPLGSSFEILTTSDRRGIQGRFHGLNEGAIFEADGFEFRITYHGGKNGRSVVLTRVAGQANQHHPKRKEGRGHDDDYRWEGELLIDYSGVIEGWSKRRIQVQTSSC